MDGALLSHPKVSEAVAFAAPDEKFGETVAAAVVPSGDVGDQAAFIADLKKHAAAKLAKFKVILSHPESARVPSIRARTDCGVDGVDTSAACCLSRLMIPSVVCAVQLQLFLSQNSISIA